MSIRLSIIISHYRIRLKQWTMDALKIKLFFLLIFCICFNANAQNSANKIKDKANQYFEYQRYSEALQYFQRYNKLKSNDKDIRLKIGICHYFTNDVDVAIKYFSSLTDNVKKPDPVALFYLGCAHHAKHDFKEAIAYYKSFLKHGSSDDPNRKAVKDEIRRCGNAMRIVYQEKLAIVENLGEKVNTPYDEFAPVQSPNYEDKMYFSSARKGNLGGLRDKKGMLHEIKGKYSSDIFSANIHNGEWTNPKRLSSLVNSPQNDVALDFSDTGKAMFIFKGFDLYSGKILVDSFRAVEDKPLYPPRFKGPMSAERADRDPYFFNDTVVIFSSIIEGGYGGSDLYIAQRSNGIWSKPQNLGPQVNSAYDETSPFLSVDGRALYFSSNNIIGMGGYDVYKTTFNDYKKEWSEVTNLGVPINSSRDDIHFRLDQDGSKAYFASSRIGGYGKRDLFVAYFKSQQMEQITQSTPAGFHTIAFENLFKKQIYSDIASVSETNYYKGEMIDFEMEPLFYDSDEDVLNSNNIKALNNLINTIKEYPQIKVELVGNSDKSDQAKFALYFSVKRAEKIADYLKNNGINDSNIIVKGCGANFPIAKDDIGAAPNFLGQRFNRRIDVVLHNTNRTPLNVLTDLPEVEEAMASNKGVFYKRAIKGLSYKVQVAEIKQNYNSDIIVKFPDATVETTANSNYYRYTVGLYQTFESAEILRKNLIRQGVTIAKVVPYVNGLPLSEREWESQTSNYPDLMNFIVNTSQD